MGIAIRSEGGLGDFPLQVSVTLECDAHTGFFCRGYEKFTGQDGFVRAHSLAMTKGWLERQGDGERKWLCPECSGK